MKKGNRNKFLTFCFSLLPGGAEMYMGFMKNGFSLLACFLCTFMILGYISASDMFIVLPIIIWFYGFFHARNLARFTEEELQARPDTYIWEEFTDGSCTIPSKTVRVVGAVTLILIGLSLILRVIRNSAYEFLYMSGLSEARINEISSLILYDLPKFVLAIILIILGILLIRGKKKQISSDAIETK